MSPLQRAMNAKIERTMRPNICSLHNKLYIREASVICLQYTSINGVTTDQQEY